MASENTQNYQIISGFQSLNDENTINALQVLIVRTTDFVTNSKLAVKLYFSNLRVSTYNNYQNYIRDESNLDLFMYFIKNQRQNQDQNQEESENNQSQVILQNKSSSPFSAQSSILTEITPSSFKKLIYLVSISIPISFNSIKVIIDDESENSNSNEGGEEYINPNYSLSTMKDLYSYLSMTSQGNPDNFSVFNDFFGGSGAKHLNGNRKGESSFVIHVNSIDDVSLCEEFFQNYLDFLKFKKNMS